MLSEQTKSVLQGFVGFCSAYGKLEGLQELGPVAVLDGYIRVAGMAATLEPDIVCREKVDIVADIEQNRREAEQFMAGILGMG